MIIGETVGGLAAALDLLRAAPTRAVVIGSLNLARTIALRSLGLGASVVVSTWRQRPWGELARGSGAPTRLMTVTGEDRFEPPEATETSPVLIIHDTSSMPQDARIAPAPWRTSLHLLSGLHPLTQHILAGADVLVLQQVDVQQATALGRLLRLPPPLVGQLSTLGPLQVVVLSKAGTLLVNLVSTPTEAQLFRAIG